MTRASDQQDSRLRLLASGKTLFASRGYEHTTTAAIAREARTSESQLVRHFSGKRALLAAIFDESWRAVNAQISEVVKTAPTPMAAIEVIFLTVLMAFDRDRELAHLFLFEGRRIHSGERELTISAGYLEFVDVLERLIRRAQKQGAITPEITAAALCSGLIAAAEGMIRDRLIGERRDGRHPFSQQQVRRVFSVLLRGTSGPALQSRGRQKD